MIRIVSVIPVARGIGRETLTYFTARDVKEGMLVSVPLRARKVPALVLGVREGTADKTDIKAADFVLKKMGESKGYVFLPSFVRAALRAARYYAAPPGAVIEALTPSAILEAGIAPSKNKNGALASPPPAAKPSSVQDFGVAKPERLLLQADADERTTLYKSLIREEFAKAHSLFLCLPTIYDTERLAQELSHGIEDHVFVFHSDYPKKELVARWKKAVMHPHPILVVATGAFLSLPRADIAAIVIEKEHSNAYKLQRRPFLDIRTFAEMYAHELGAKLIVADLKLRVETLYRREERDYTEFMPLKFRAASQARSVFVDMKEDNKDPVSGKTTFAPIGKELEALLRAVATSGSRLFALVSRRGLHPVTICNDCGTVVLCERCKTPLVLHRTLKTSSAAATKNIYMCHSCRRETASRDRCDSCASWRLAPLGAGTEYAEEIIKEKFPSLAVFRLDKETGSTPQKIAALVDVFYKTPGSVLVGTEFAISFLRNVPHAAVISCDSLFVIPDFRMNERVFALLLSLRAKTEETFLLQTRMPHMPVFKEGLRGDIANFYREEIRVRKEFGYPPFATLIKLSVSGTEKKVAVEVATILEALHVYAPVAFPARKETSGAESSMRILLKVKTRWPDEELLKILMALPPSVEVRVDPEDTL